MITRSYPIRYALIVLGNLFYYIASFLCAFGIENENQDYIIDIGYQTKLG